MKSKNKSFELILFSDEAKNKLISLREGEMKLGQKISSGKDFETFYGKYVILGISEDIGPQSNGGFSGADASYNSFLSRFLNIQSNQFIDGKEICVFGEIKSNVKFESILQGRKIVEELDEFVVSILEKIIVNKFFPIVIGGGHNNAFPLIKAFSLIQNRPINVINCDPHADFRKLEGRHSGNPFSYAFFNKYLDDYAVIGLHQSYNSEYILSELTKHNFLHSFFETYIVDKNKFKVDLDFFLKRIASQSFGAELDLDSISFMPSSAYTPSGLTVEEARYYVMKVATSKNILYLHLPEASPKNEMEERIVGKTLAYLVSDFIKNHMLAN
jgi:formiminoglutamase